MYKKIERNQRMTTNEASVRYPESFILVQRDSRELSNAMGTVLYVGDDYDELFSLMLEIDESSLCIVIEGLNHQRSLGGVVVGG